MRPIVTPRPSPCSQARLVSQASKILNNNRGISHDLVKTGHRLCADSLFRSASGARLSQWNSGSNGTHASPAAYEGRIDQARQPEVTWLACTSGARGVSIWPLMPLTRVPGGRDSMDRIQRQRAKRHCKYLSGNQNTAVCELAGRLSESDCFARRVDVKRQLVPGQD